MITVYIVLIKTLDCTYGVLDVRSVRVGAVYGTIDEADAEIKRIEAANPWCRGYVLDRQLKITEN